MRNLMLTLALALSVVGAGANAESPSTKGTLKGDYVEARTASVFAGPCHFNGELTTRGREATLAWNIQEGTWNGVSLTGIKAMAALSSDDNLREENTPHRAVLFIDTKASKEQAAALTDAFQTHYGKVLGKVVAVKRVPISFTRKDATFRVSAKGAAELSIQAMPDNACCKMPSMVCYSPLVTLTDRKVGYTNTSGVQDKTLGGAWTYSGQNSAFYGTFKL